MISKKELVNHRYGFCDGFCVTASVATLGMLHHLYIYLTTLLHKDFMCVIRRKKRYFTSVVEANSSHQHHSTLLHRGTLKCFRGDSNFSRLLHYKNAHSLKEHAKKGFPPKMAKRSIKKFDFAEVRTLEYGARYIWIGVRHRNDSRFQRLLYWTAWRFAPSELQCTSAIIHTWPLPLNHVH